MKTEELMTRDLVQYKGEIYYVTAIYSAADLVGLYPYHRKNKKGEFLLHINCIGDNCEPIPLTPEILKTNGWREVRNHVYGAEFEENIKERVYHFNIPFRVHISTAYFHEKMFPTINDDILINILYVHELQHALRLCGLNELADNFKV